MKKKAAKPIVHTTPSPAPDWLPETARTVWDRVASDLARDALYDPTFDFLLADFCIAQAAIMDTCRAGDSPAPALLAQVRQLAVSLAVDPEARRERIRMRGPASIFDC